MVLWGGGNFGPTLKGHAAAPNKLLRQKLAEHGVKIHVVDEHKTSKRTACCHRESKYSVQQQQPPKQRRLRPEQEQQKSGDDGHHQAASAPAPAPQQSQPPPAKRKKLRGLLYCTSCHHQFSALHDRIYHHHHGYQQVDVDRTESGQAEEEEEKEGKNEKAEGAQHSSNVSNTARQSKGTRPWNRDVCAAINILNRTYLNAVGRLPECFNRAARRTNTAAA